MCNCYILCNVDNNITKYIDFAYAGSNLSFYVAESIKDDYDVHILNVGAPLKSFDKNKYNKNIINGISIHEFDFGLDIFPIFIKAKNILKNAINFLINNFKEGDKVIIYHSLAYSKYYQKIITKVGQNNVTLLLAEIYSDVGNISYSRDKEIKKIQIFNGYIFMSKSLKDCILRFDNKKFIYLYGAYNNNFKIKCNRFNFDCFNVVYAGTSSKEKGGLENAIKAITYLPKNFKLHIFSNCDEQQIKNIKSVDNCVYHGYVSPKKLNLEICNYDIGLACQNSKLSFNNSSFPSKIINYLGCGLMVVSSRSQSVIDSPFSQYVFFTKNDDPKELADTILKVSKNLNNVKFKVDIKKFDLDFKKEIAKLLKR